MVPSWESKYWNEVDDDTPLSPFATIGDFVVVIMFGLQLVAWAIMIVYGLLHWNDPVLAPTKPWQPDKNSTGYMVEHEDDCCTW